MSTGCEFYGDALVDLAADTLDPGRAEQVRAHVADCRECGEALEVIRAVHSAPAPVPEGLEARLQAAVVAVAGTSPVPVAGEPRATAGAGSATSPTAERPAPRTMENGRWWTGWRPWALPVAAAAAVALWLGANQVLAPDAAQETGTPVEVATEYDPYGALPGEDGEVAGDLVLSQLSVDELEALLEEMQ